MPSMSPVTAAKRVLKLGTEVSKFWTSSRRKPTRKGHTACVAYWRPQHAWRIGDHKQLAIKSACYKMLRPRTWMDSRKLPQKRKIHMSFGPAMPGVDMDQVHWKMLNVCDIFSDLTHPMGPCRHYQQTTTHFFYLTGNAGQHKDGRVFVHKNGSLISMHRVRVRPISDPFRIRVSQPRTYLRWNYVQGVSNKFLKYHTKILQRFSMSEVVKDDIFERQYA